MTEDVGALLYPRREVFHVKHSRIRSGKMKDLESKCDRNPLSWVSSGILDMDKPRKGYGDTSDTPLFHVKQRLIAQGRTESARLAIDCTSFGKNA